MKLDKFYDVIRKTFTLTNQNITGFDFILKEGESRQTPINDLAYMLATAWLETAHTMQPIKEYGGNSYFHKMYDIKGSRPSVAKRLGNTEPGDGVKYPGRGYVQLTGRANYAKASKKFNIDFINKPDLVMHKEYALPILFVGMEEGWFTGKKLRDFIDTIDESDAEDGKEFEGARRIINGTDKAKTIAGYALIFEKALKAGEYGFKQPEKPVQPVFDDPGVEVPENPKVSLWALLTRLFSTSFGRT